MKKIILLVTVAGMMSLYSCKKCNTCTGADINDLNHDYCGEIYRTNKTMEAAKDQCEIRGGVWSEKAE